jgi:hypothetical protein
VIQKMWQEKHRKIQSVKKPVCQSAPMIFTDSFAEEEDIQAVTGQKVAS